MTLAKKISTYVGRSCSNNNTLREKKRERQRQRKYLLDIPVGVCELLCLLDQFEADSEVISRTDDNISAIAELMSVHYVSKLPWENSLYRTEYETF